MLRRNLISRRDYLPFGDVITNGRTGVSRYDAWGTTPQFTGEVRDAESGLDYLGARYLSGTQGRFTSPDVPLVDQVAGDPLSWNLYGYVRNNPVSFTDPSGNACIVGPKGDYDDGGPGQSCAEARKPQEFTFDGSTNSMSGATAGGLSMFGQLFINQMAMRRDASNQMIGAVSGGSAVVGAAAGTAPLVLQAGNELMNCCLVRQLGGFSGPAGRWPPRPQPIRAQGG